MWSNEYSNARRCDIKLTSLLTADQMSTLKRAWMLPVDIHTKTRRILTMSDKGLKMNLNQLRRIYPVLKEYFENRNELQYQYNSMGGLIWRDLYDNFHFDIDCIIRVKPSIESQLNDIAREMRSAIGVTPLTTQGALLLESYAARVDALVASMQVEEKDNDSEEDENYYDE